MITVGIPVYNARKYLNLCLRSLAKNVTLDIELIIVDDRSSENIREEISSFAKENNANHIKKIIYIQNKKSMGFPHNANIILENSACEIICVLNSDTYVCPGAFEKIVDVMNSSPKIMIAGPSTCSTNSVQEIYEYSKEIDIPEEKILVRAREVEKRFENKTLELSQRETNSQVQGFCFFLKKEAIDKIGYFDEVYGVGTYEESDYNSRADFLGSKAVWVKHAYVHHFGRKSWTLLKALKIISPKLSIKNEKIWLEKIRNMNSDNVKTVKRNKPDFHKEIILQQ